MPVKAEVKTAVPEKPLEEAVEEAEIPEADIVVEDMDRQSRGLKG